MPRAKYNVVTNSDVHAKATRQLLRYSLARIEADRCRRELELWSASTFKNAPIYELMNALERKVNDMLTLRAKIESLIDSLQDDRYRVIMRLRYIEGLKWEDVARLVPMEYRWMLRLHRRALDILIEAGIPDIEI